MADEHLLRDLRLELRHRTLRPVYAAATEVADPPPGRPGAPGRLDLGTVAGRDNLGQAVLMRLLTPRGELAPLAHPEYGSRLHELIGRPNTEVTRNLARLHILESLALEPRVAEVASLQVAPATGRRDAVEILLRVRPVGGSGTVQIGPFTLELAP